jgi:hypothetical protein
MSNACQYVDDDAKVCHVFAKVSLKGVQSSLQKIITWTKKYRKGTQKWKDSCVITRLLARRFKTPMKT